jgi:hypothetical protein
MSVMITKFIQVKDKQMKILEYTALKDLLTYEKDGTIYYCKVSTILKRGSTFTHKEQKRVCDYVNTLQQLSKHSTQKLSQN